MHQTRKTHNAQTKPKEGLLNSPRRPLVVTFPNASITKVSSSGSSQIGIYGVAVGLPSKSTPKEESGVVQNHWSPSNRAKGKGSMRSAPNQAGVTSTKRIRSTSIGCGEEPQWKNRPIPTNRQKGNHPLPMSGNS